MSGFILTLGNAGFTIEDVPDSLPLGGTQATAIRKFPGGGVHVQTLGAYDQEMAWDSFFYGPGAWQRAQAIGDIRIAGKEVLLRYRNITRYVIVEEFTVGYMTDEYVTYSIKLQPTVKSGVPISVGSPAVSTSTASPTPKSQVMPANDQASPPPAQRKYTIKSGDTLIAIAFKYYKDANQWVKIQAANPGIVPTKLKIGSTIIIP